MILIMGRTGSGKDYLAKQLAKHGLSILPSYSTREPRHPGENTHVFIKPGEVDLYPDKVATVVLNDCMYFSTREQVLQHDIYVIDPKGVKELLLNCPEIPFTVCYVETSLDVRMKNALDRVAPEDRAEEQAVFVARNLDENPIFSEFEDILHDKKALDLYLKRYPNIKYLIPVNNDSRIDMESVAKDLINMNEKAKLDNRYSFLKKPRHEGLRQFPLGTIKMANNIPEYYTQFISNVFINPIRYSRDAVRLVKANYEETASFFPKTKDLLEKPEFLQPKGVSVTRLWRAEQTYRVTAEIDGKIVQADLAYDEETIKRYSQSNPLPFDSQTEDEVGFQLQKNIADDLANIYVQESLSDAFAVYRLKMPYSKNEARIEEQIEHIASVLYASSLGSADVPPMFENQVKWLASDLHSLNEGLVFNALFLITNVLERANGKALDMTIDEIGTVIDAFTCHHRAQIDYGPLDKLKAEKTAGFILTTAMKNSPDGCFNHIDVDNYQLIIQELRGHPVTARILENIVNNEFKKIDGCEIKKPNAPLNVKIQYIESNYFDLKSLPCYF